MASTPALLAVSMMESIERYAPTGESPSPTMYDSSALWRCAAATSSWLKMLTVSIWSSWAARQMRMAISPRFAARTLLKGLSFCAQHRARVSRTGRTVTASRRF